MRYRVYISGKMTGDAEYEKHFNGMANYLRDNENFIVFNPCDWNKHMVNYNLTYTEMLEIDILHLKMCDAIYLLDGWKDSDGACAELFIALQRAEMNVMFENPFDQENNREKLLEIVINKLENSNKINIGWLRLI